MYITLRLKKLEVIEHARLDNELDCAMDELLQLFSEDERTAIAEGLLTNEG